MIGLQRFSVVLSESDATWAHIFEQERERILSVASDLVCQVLHIGSTSVPGLMAKPIIDLAAVVSCFKIIGELSARLAKRGWIDRGYVRPDNYLFVQEIAPEVRTHHLHVVTEGSTQLDEYLRFREALIESSELRQAYTELKIKLATQYKANRAAYTEAKSEFIQRIVKRNQY